jgi:hypothetical protein
MGINVAISLYDISVHKKKAISSARIFSYTHRKWQPINQGRIYSYKCVFTENIMYNVWPLLNAKCKLLGLLTTPLDLLHLFIYDSNNRHYNLSFTMSSDPLMSCLGAVL